MVKNRITYFILILCWLLVASILADKCQCGPRCSAYKFENLCVRCCTSAMRRRSIPFTNYPPSIEFEELKNHHKRIDDELLFEIVEVGAQLIETTNNDRNKMEQIPLISLRRSILYQALGLDGRNLSR